MGFLVVLLVFPLVANADDDWAGSFFKGAQITGAAYLFGRNRERWNTEAGEYEKHLDHMTAQGAIDFQSREYSDRLTLKAGIFGAYDLYTGIDPDDPGGPIQQENEFSFAGDRWGENYSDGKASSGASLYKMTGFYKLNRNLSLQAGMGQFRLPGLIGPNWSYVPGSYRGFGLYLDVGEQLKLSYIYVDRYKAPWFKKLGRFSTKNAWDSDRFEEGNNIDYLHGVSAEFPFFNHDITLSIGESEGYMRSYFGKISKEFEVGDGLKTSYQFYGSDTQGQWDHSAHGYQGLATYQAITSSLKIGKYLYRLEGTAVDAEGELGNYLPRLTRGYGNSQGGLEIWWDLRSDWNEHNEKAVFFSVSRDMTDVFKHPGWTLSLGGAYGWDIEYKDLPKNAKESAWKIDISYNGKLLGVDNATVVLHYMEYRNHQDELPSWSYPNLFRSERDLMLKVILPFKGI